MTIMRLIPAALSLLLLAAHFLRSGDLLFVGLALAVAGLLFVRRPWAGHVVQWVLLVGAFEWLRTLVVLVDERRLDGLPYTRLAVILGAVGGFSLLSAATMWGPRTARYFARAASRDA
jgi:hypothetical protein